jgi:aminoglycoside phosphotransferase (APT) family kinase protein
MSSDPFGAVAAAHRDTARAALAAAFGSASVDAIAPVSGGASGAFIYRVDCGGQRALLRVEGAPSPLRNPHQYISMRMAAEAGIAPRIHHIDETARVAVMDYIEQQPLDAYPGGPDALVRALGALLARLQATPAFPYFVDYPDIVGRLFAHVRRTGLFADGLLDAHTERLAQITRDTTWDPAKLVSSHNDAILRNILFDGERLWLIDWESAYRNDPLVDVAIMLDNLAPSPELEAALLQAWLGRAPDAALLARLAPIRALTRLYYAGVLLSASATLPRAAPDGDLSAPALAEFQSAIRDGRFKPRAPDTIHAAGKMYLAAFLSGEAVPALDTI